MPKKPEKCIFILSEKLSKGLALNCTALLGSSLGGQYPSLIGENFEDADGVFHMGLLSFPVAILKAKEEELIQIRHNALELENTKCIDCNKTIKASKTGAKKNRCVHYRCKACLDKQIINFDLSPYMDNVDYIGENDNQKKNGINDNDSSKVNFEQDIKYI